MLHGLAILAGTASKSFFVLTAAWLLAVLLRKHSAATRHLLWTTAFVALLALPLLSIVLPAIFAPRLSRDGVIFRTMAVQPVVQVLSPSAGFTETETPHRESHQESTFPLISIAWAIGMGISFLHMVIGWCSMTLLRRSARPFRQPSVGGIPVLEAPAGTMPMTCGVLRRVILVPAEAQEWSPERLRLVLLHELAHVRRGDVATHLLARLALGVYWWNPLVWIAWREFLWQRECAADDLVLEAGTAPTEYAENLLAIAHAMQPAGNHGWATVAMVRRSQLEARLESILETGRSRTAPPQALAWLAAGLALALITPLVTLRAQDIVQTVPADADATIRAAVSQRNHEMLDSAANAAEAYGRFDLARKLLDSSLAIREQAAGQGTVEYGLGLVKLGDLERDRRNLEEAKVFYTKALGVLERRPEAAPVLVDLGLLGMMVPRPPQAASQAVLSQRMQDTFEYLEQARLADSGHTGPVLMWMAVLREQQKNSAAAESLFEQALAAEDPTSLDAAITKDLYASFLERQGRKGEAETFIAQASETRLKHELQARQSHREMEGVFRVGPDVAAPTLVRKIEPEYSDEARLARYQGKVVLSLTVGADGTAKDMRVVRSLGLGLDQKALQALSQWRFRPGSKDGQPVAVAATIEVNFRLL